ncbi:TIGR03086 family metal-binding protein [Luedemannella flava]|uniref:TIGR03086 family metal-binding protein n=1 Tax=Luedemannella flava TaxID=349316 RepID=A0ABP4YIZ7_9ACTN
MDVEELHRRSVEAFVALVGQVPADRWGDPTPCTDWTVRELVNHLVYEQLWTPPMFAGATIAEVGDRFEGDLLGDDPAAATRAAAAGAIAAVAEPGALTRTVHLSFGDTPAEEYARQLSADHLIHSWDLAKGAGLSGRLDPELVDEVAAWFVDREHAYRASGVIGLRPIPVSDHPQDRLLNAFGRASRYWED